MTVLLDSSGRCQHQRLAQVAMVEGANPLRSRTNRLALGTRHHVIIDNMMNATAPVVEATSVPPNLYFAMTGETFEFKTSAKAGDGVFRFRWTLAGGKKGPPEHVHDDEHDIFSVVSGTLRIWLDGTPRDLHAGDSVTVERGVAHRFFNPTKQPVVVDVSLDGPRQEDALVPLAFRCEGRRKMKLSDAFVMIVHATEINASRPRSGVAKAIVSGLSRFIRLFGVRPLARIERW
jgi:mannose-6-phosphate isomerase-like protein (cupin superfamily)